MIKVGIVFGTRPEAIKMAPLVLEMQARPEFNVVTIVTAQHRQMLDQVLELFGIVPEYDLNLMKPNQDLWGLTCEVLTKTREVFETENFDIVLVHGDTTTAFATSLSAFYSRIKVGHVEAGLRTFNKNYPFPEEINRVLADAVSDLHFAPTDKAIENLKNSGIKNVKQMHKTGNTVIDALLYTVKNHKADLTHLGLEPNLRTILLTAHRRENFGKPLESLCDAILDIIEQNKDVQVVYPVHLNPNVQNIVNAKLSGAPRVKLIEPLDYAPFASLMQESYLILTDSGGVQEEAPSLGKPVLVLRDETERPEAIEFGGVKLVGCNREKIVSNVNELLHNPEAYQKMSKTVNPYGDGLASKRIADIILKSL